MSDQPIANPRDSTRVSLETERDVEYWTNRFAVSEQRLRAALERSGGDVDAIIKALSQ